MPTQTYDPIASASFSGYTSGTINLPTTGYTDLVLIINNAGSGGDNGWITLNGDASRNISWAVLGGTSGGSISKSSSGNPSVLYSLVGAQYANPGTFHFFDYRNSGFHKQILAEVSSSYGVQLAQYTYPNTSPITSMEIRTQTYSSMGTGSWSLYGITRA